MTAIVGVLCTDGVVIGTDSSATFCAGASKTIEQPTEKLYVCGEHVIVEGTGPAGLGQRFCAIVEKNYQDKLFVKSGGKSAMETSKILCRLACEDFAFTGARPGQYGALVAFPAGGMPNLCEFAQSDFQPELKSKDMWYCSMGSAQHITDSFLALIRRVFWVNGPPTLADGVFAAYWTLKHAIEVNPGGVNGPVRLAVLEAGSKGAHRLSEDDIEAHDAFVGNLEEHLRGFRAKLSTPEKSLPTPPSE